MVFHIRLGLRRGADAKPHGDKSILLVKSAAIGVDLKRVQKEMLRREMLGVLEQIPANPAPLKIRMDEKLIHEIARDGEEARRAPVHFGHPEIVVLRDHVSEILTIFLEGVTLRALKIREGFFARCAPQARHCLEIIE